MIGASPRLRGKRGRAAWESGGRGCIPAPAGETRVVLVRPSLTGVHPRACGGNSGNTDIIPASKGASPRLRGKPPDTGRRGALHRCIPAPAGETSPAAGTGRAGPVHPRACGGNWRKPGGADRTVGASPRLRGKPPGGGRNAGGRGCIPAPAGETPCCQPSPSESGVHPRACGGNGVEKNKYLADRGASPRLRGKPTGRTRCRTRWRCIPAPAGETSALSAGWSVISVHPRACGGNLPAVRVAAACFGASPRLRGKPGLPDPHHQARRCIPAPAGETPATTRTSTSGTVHPRACGTSPATRPRGASPRLRGKLTPTLPFESLMGCIPAPAGETKPSTPKRQGRQVHPRACGGNFTRFETQWRIRGASPRLRGKLRPGPSHRNRHRCIPAPAGETLRRSRSLAPVAVHPRACGGNRTISTKQAQGGGASPRLRGKRLPDCLPPLLVGCIPAPAGETWSAPGCGRSRRVHPRACGGNVMSHKPNHEKRGASPRLRGKRPPSRQCPAHRGCIPAPAGETRAAGSRAGRCPVHPRACGGNIAGADTATPQQGASPRLRGKRTPGKSPNRSAGCIPAPAGETYARGARSVSPGVHPRACGGNACLICSVSHVVGASPRLRGKRRAESSPPWRARCIPAPAGETAPRRPPARRSSVHPRACGGNLLRAVSRPPGAGASPRLRGKRMLLGETRDRPGCIPAPAGETPTSATSARGRPVHPRACGGNPGHGERGDLADGASPRLRGKRGASEPPVVGLRCIPAPAGETGA